MQWQRYQDNPADEAQLQAWNDELKPALWGIVTNGKIAVTNADTAETKEAVIKELGPTNRGNTKPGYLRDN